MFSAASGITYNASTRTLEWRTVAKQSGARISFFAQLAEDKRNPQTPGSTAYDTNTTMYYAPVVNDEIDTSKQATISVDDNYRVSHTMITAVKSNGDKYNKVVAIGDEITYTIELTNTTGMDLTGVVVTDPVPAGTSYVSADAGATYDASSNAVIYTAESLPAGGKLSFSFTVKVNESATEIVNEATFSVSEATDDKGNPLTARTNELRNSTPTPTPVVTPTPVPDTDSLPKTGDSSRPVLWFALCALSTAALLRRRRRA